MREIRFRFYDKTKKEMKTLKKNNKISQRCWNCKNGIVAGDREEGTYYYICEFTHSPTENDGLYCDKWEKGELCNKNRNIGNNECIAELESNISVFLGEGERMK